MSGVTNNARAGDVYKYVDDNGTLVYSDLPPANRQAFEEVKLPYYPPANPEARRQTIEQMRETSDRLRADRLEREAARKPEEKPDTATTRPRAEEERRVYPYWYRQQRIDRESRNRGRRYSGPTEPSTGEERLRQNLRSPLNVPRQ